LTIGGGVWVLVKVILGCEMVIAVVYSVAYSDV